MILTQLNKIAQAVISNGLVTGNPVQNPDNLLNTTDSTAIFGPTSDVIIGNFPFNIPLNAVIVGISGILKARIDNSSIPAGSITPALVDGATYYPGTPVTGLSDVLQEYNIGGAYDVWGNVNWTPAKLNNMRLQLIGNSSLEVAWASMTVYYYIPQTSLIPPPFTLPGCADCDSTIQALPFKLVQPWLPGQTKLYLESFSLPDEDPITLAMLGACGGTINLTIDPDLRKEDGGDFIENFNLDDQLATITPQTDGIVELDIGVRTQRGLGFDTPYGYDVNNESAHAVGAVVIITNNGPWNGKLLKRCHIGTLVGAPMEVQDEGNIVAVAVDKMNFIGDPVQAEQDPINPRKANITINSNPTNIKPTKENVGTGTTNTTPALTLTVPLTVVSANYLRVGVITENETIIDVQYNGVSMVFIGNTINPGVNLKVALYGIINPAVGTHNVVVSMLSPRIITAIVTGWKDVDVTNPVDGVSGGNIGSDNTPTDSVATSADNTIVEDVVGTTHNPTTFTQFGLWSIDGAVNTGIRPGASSSRSVLAPQTVTDIYNLSVATGWAILLAGIRGITSTPPGSGIVSINADTTPAQLLTNTDGLISITQPAGGTNRFNIVLANLITALINSATFIAGIVSKLINNVSFITGLTSNALFQTLVNGFVGGGSVINVTPPLDDFLSTFPLSGGGYISGNFAFQAQGQYLAAEDDHPGIIRCGNNQHLYGFAKFNTLGGVPGPVLGQLDLNTGFNIEIETRINYIPTNTNYFWQLLETGIRISFSIAASNTTFTPVLNINGSAVSITPPVKPVSGAWFKIIYKYTAGVLTVTANGTIIYTNAVSFAGAKAYIDIHGPFASITGTLDTDYVATNYTVNR